MFAIHSIVLYAVALRLITTLSGYYCTSKRLAFLHYQAAVVLDVQLWLL